MLIKRGSRQFLKTGPSSSRPCTKEKPPYKRKKDRGRGGNGRGESDHRGIGDPRRERFEELEVIADTGSIFTTVPRKLLEELGVPVERTVQSELAGGRVVPTDVGRTLIRLEGREFPTPVFFGEECEPSLLGVITLEHALPAVGPTTADRCR